MSDLIFTRRYAMAHRLLAAPSSKCVIPHGHNEIVSVRLEPHEMFQFGGANALAPFEAIKKRWHAWIDNAVDHAFQLDANDPLINYFREHEPERLSRIMTFQGDPTTEALAASFWLKLEAFLKADGLPFSPRRSTRRRNADQCRHHHAREFQAHRMRPARALLAKARRYEHQRFRPSIIWGRMNVLSPALTPILMLIASNVFMTFAWYGHLKFRNSPIFLAILVSWGIALFEYCLAVPANRIGRAVYSTAELKTMQEVITLIVFALFSIFVLKEALTWRHALGFALIAAGAGVIFSGKPL